MIIGDAQEGLESIVSLFVALEGDKSISAGKSLLNIQKNIVKVMGFRGKARKEGCRTVREVKAEGSGLMLTSDGWVVTAYHNIADYVNGWARIKQPTESNIEAWLANMTLRYAVVDQKGVAYPIDVTFWHADPEKDIALVKAVIMKKPKPLAFRTAMHGLKEGESIALYGLEGMKPYSAAGRVMESESGAVVCRDNMYQMRKGTFLTDVRAAEGISGGPFVTAKGELAGILLCGGQKGKQYESNGAKLSNARSLAREAVCMLGRDLISSS